MLHAKWSGQDYSTDDIDPGRDIFALLFLSFFLINSVIMLCVSKQGEKTVNVNTAGKARGKVIEASLLASIAIIDEKVCVTQNGISYYFPEDMDHFRKEARFETRHDEKGNKHLTIIVHDPGKAMTAGEMLAVVQMLNNADIGVDFRTVRVKRD